MQRIRSFLVDFDMYFDEHFMNISNFVIFADKDWG